MKTAEHYFNNSDKTVYKYPAYKNIIVLIVVLFGIGMAIAPFVPIIIALIKAYNIGFSRYAIYLIKYVEYYILLYKTAAHPLFLLCGIVVLMFVCVDILYDILNG